MIQQLHTFGLLSLSVPSSWSDNTVVNLVGPPLGRFRPNIAVTRQLVPPMTLLSAWGQQQALLLENSGLPDFTVIEQDVVRIGDHKFYLFCYTWNNPPHTSEPHATPDRLFQAQYTMLHEGVAYTLTFTCLAESAEELRELREEIVQSFAVGT